MFKYKLAVTILTLFIFTVFEAQLETAHWYFGNLAGLDFTTGTPISDTEGVLSTNEGCASISDREGNLLFYTSGTIVYNKNHEIMKNGEGLLGDPSSTQSAIIVPIPENEKLYYIFTVDADDSFPEDIEGLHYSLVDMSLDSGMGEIVNDQKNIPLPLQGIQKSSEKVTAVRHANGKHIWVITHFLDSFYSFLITSSGINVEPVISKIGINIPFMVNEKYVYPSNGRGYMKASPNGKKLAVAHLSSIQEDSEDLPKNINSFYEYTYGGFLGLYDFDTSTGIVSNEIQLSKGERKVFYGLEFSANSKVFYAEYDLFTSPNIRSWKEGNLIQFDLQSSDIPSTENILYKFTEGNFDTARGALQLAVDKKIYYARNFESYISVINNPDIYGEQADFVLKGIDLKERISYYGLPPFMTSFFEGDIISKTDFCLGEISEFTFHTNEKEIIVEWDFGDASPLVKGDKVQHQYDTIGVYKVRAIAKIENRTIELIKEVIINPIPIINILDKYQACQYLDIDLGEYPSGYIIRWKNSQGQIVSTSSKQRIIISDVYFIEVISDKGCVQSKEVQVIIGSLPEINLKDIYFCSNETGRIMDGGDFAEEYKLEWYNQENTFLNEGRFLEVTKAGVYKLVVTNLLTGCKNSSLVSVIEYSIPQVKAVIIEGDRVTLELEFYQDQGLEYSLDNINWQNSPIFKITRFGKHTVYVKTYNGCINKIDFIMLSIPNVITFNGDLKNDHWVIKGLELYSGSEIKIFDRRGKLLLNKIYFKNPIWDGTYLGRKVSTDAYWYLITLPTGQYFRGWIYVKNYN